MDKDIVISIISPLYNEQNNVEYFVQRVLDVMKSQQFPFELILVDDGSTDCTWHNILQQTSYEEVKGIKLSRNFGHQGALLSGMSQAKGNALITLDSDLQHPPEVIPQLIEQWISGAKVVLTEREDRGKVSAFKYLSSKYFYRVFSSIADTRIEPGNSDFRLIDRQPFENLSAMKYGEPFLRGAINTLGYSAKTIKYQIEERHSGESKYSLLKMLRFARHGIISHSHTPLHVSIYLGFLTGLMSLFELGYVVSHALKGKTIPGWASTLVIISIMFTILFFIIGIIGLYLIDIHKLLKNKPYYIIDEIAENYTESSMNNTVTEETS